MPPHNLKGIFNMLVSEVRENEIENVREMLIKNHGYIYSYDDLVDLLEGYERDSTTKKIRRKN